MDEYQNKSSPQIARKCLENNSMVQKLVILLFKNKSPKESARRA